MDLSHLLCSNEPPNPSEITVLRAAFADLVVQQLELQLRLDEIEEKVRQHAAVLSPVRRVPLEILSDIFTLVVFGARRSKQPGSSSMMYTYPDTREWVVALSLVCRHWRRAALVTRAFWSQVSVDCALNGVVSRHIAYDKVGTWLSHQEVLPRVLEVGRKYFEDTCCEHDELVCRYEDASFGGLLVTGPVLDKLVLWLQDPECLQNLLNLSQAASNGWQSGVGGTAEGSPRSSLNQLNSLALHFAGWMSDPDTLASHSCFVHLPPVKKFELYLPRMEDTFENVNYDGGEEECDKAELNIPHGFLERLEEFTYHCDWSLRHATGPLAHCTSLKKLVLDFTGQVSQFQHPVEANTPLADRLSSKGLTLPNLRILQVKKCAWTDSIEHVKFLRAPALKTLDIELDNNGDSWVKMDQVELWWNPLVNRIDCLRTLSLRDMEFDTGVLTAMKIQELPALIHLTLDSVYPLEELFGESGPFNDTPTTSGGRPFPALRVFELLHLESYFDLELVFDFVENRRARAVDGKATTASNGISDSIKSIVAMYYDFDSEFAERSESYYERAQVLTDAGVMVKIGELYQDFSG